MDAAVTRSRSPRALPERRPPGRVHGRVRRSASRLLLAVLLLLVGTSLARGQDYPNVPRFLWRVSMMDWNVLKKVNEAGETRMLNLFTDENGARDYYDAKVGGMFRPIAEMARDDPTYRDLTLYRISKEDLASTPEGRAFLEMVDRELGGDPRRFDFTMNLPSEEAYRATVIQHAEVYLAHESAPRTPPGGGPGGGSPPPEPPDPRSTPPEQDTRAAGGGDPEFESKLADPGTDAYARPPADSPIEPKPDVAAKIEAEIRARQPGEMDVPFMERLYSMDPDAAKIIGGILGKDGMESRNRRMGDLRKQMDDAIWADVLERRNVPIQTTNQGKDNGGKSDLDYTLYHLADITGVPIEDLIEDHRRAWVEKHGVEPARMEIEVMNGDLFYPDFRNAYITTADHKARVAKSLLRLRSKDGVYEVPGANKNQVHDRALLEGTTVQRHWDVESGRMVEVEVPTHRAWRYTDVSLLHDQRNALGVVVQEVANLHRHDADGVQESIRRKKHFNRIVNEGIGNLSLFANTYQQIHNSGLPGDRKRQMKRDYLRRGLDPLGIGPAIPDATLDEYIRVVDVSMEIEQDKIDSRADYEGKRAEYFREYVDRAAENLARNPAAALMSVEEAEAWTYAEMERLYELDARKVAFEAHRAAVQYAAWRDLSVRGALRNALRFEADPETGRPRAIIDVDRIDKIAFERATEVMLMFEEIARTTDPDERQRMTDDVMRAVPDDLRPLFRDLAVVKSSEVDNYLRNPNDPRRLAVDAHTRKIRDQLRRKLERLGEAGIEVVSEAEAERMVGDAELTRQVLDNRVENLNTRDRSALRSAIDLARSGGRGPIFDEMYGKATGLMMGASALNVIQAYQTGNEQVLRHALFTESLNFLPDFVEVPFTVMDVALRARVGDPSGFFDLLSMGLLRFKPQLGHVMLVYAIGSGTWNIARTYAVTRIDNDLVEQAFRSRPVDSSGDPLPGSVRARRNPYKDSSDFRGDPPLYPLFYREFPVPENGMSDAALIRRARSEFGAQIVRDLKEEGVERYTPEWRRAGELLTPDALAQISGEDLEDLYTEEWKRRRAELEEKYGFDLPYYTRMRAMYEHYSPLVGRYVAEATGPGSEYVEDVALRKYFHEAVMKWYYEQPDGYRREFEGYFDMFFGNTEQQLLDRVIGQAIAEYRRQEDLEYARLEEEEQQQAKILAELENARRTEKRVLATGKRIQAEIAERYERQALARAEEAKELVEREPELVLEFPFTWATERTLPELQIELLGTYTGTAPPLEATIEEEIVAYTAGAPAGWKPEPEVEEWFVPDEEGDQEYYPVTVDHRFRVKVHDADHALVAEDEVTIPIVYYLPLTPFGGRVGVRVLAETESGETYPYNGALVTLGDQTDVSGPIDGWASFGGLPEGTYTATAAPRDGDERHGEASGGSTTLVDALVSGGESVTSGEFEIVLPYVPPPDDGGADDDGEDESGDDEGGDDEGGDDEGGDDEGGDDEGGDDEGGGGGGGLTPEEILDRIGTLTRENERLRDQARAACDFQAAADAQARLVQDVGAFLAETFPAGAPADIQVLVEPYDLELLALLQAADAEIEAKRLLVQARDQIYAREVEDALTTLEAASDVPNVPSCLRDQILDLHATIMVDVIEDLAHVTDQAVAATEACDYAAALAEGRKVQVDYPTLSWVQDELPKIEDLARRQEEAARLIGEARSLAAQERYDEAISIAQRALSTAPECDKAAMETALREIGADANAATAEPESVAIERSVMLLIDTSGSMSGDKIGAAKSAAVQSIRGMGPAIEVAVATYGGGCSGGWGVVVDFTTDHDQAIAAVEGLGTGGGTPMTPAIRFAQEYVERNGRGRGGAQILLLNDGQNSCSSPSVTEAADGLRRSSMSIQLDAVGVGLAPGSQAERDLDELVSAAGGGTRYSASNTDEVVSAFRRASYVNQVKTTDPWIEGGMSPSLEQVLTRVLTHFLRDDYEGALNALEEGLLGHPDSPSLHFNASLAHEIEGNHLQAKEHAERYLTLAPNALDAGSVRARIEMLEEAQREKPHAVYEPFGCDRLYRWAQRESRRASGDPARRTLVYDIMTTAQRGACEEAEAGYETYQARYGTR